MIEYSTYAYTATRSPARLRIADGEEYCLRFAGVFLKCLWAPWVPVNRVVGVLLQVWGFLVDETVGVFMLTVVGLHGMSSSLDGFAVSIHRRGGKY